VKHIQKQNFTIDLCSTATANTLSKIKKVTAVLEIFFNFGNG